MPRKTHRPEEIMAQLRQADVLLGEGKKVPEVVKTLGIHEVTYYRWRKECGGMNVNQARRLKEPETIVFPDFALKDYAPPSKAKEVTLALR